jgi:hypothetical protein
MTDSTRRKKNSTKACLINMLVVTKERNNNDDTNVQGGKGRGLSYLPDRKNVESRLSIGAIMIICMIR